MKEKAKKILKKVERKGGEVGRAAGILSEALDILVKVGEAAVVKAVLKMLLPIVDEEDKKEMEELLGTIKQGGKR